MKDTNSCDRDIVVGNPETNMNVVLTCTSSAFEHSWRDSKAQVKDTVGQSWFYA